MFCLLLNAEQLLVPDYHMMDMNIISLVTISLLMVSAYELLRGTVVATGGNRIDIIFPNLMSTGGRRLHQILDRTGRVLLPNSCIVYRLKWSLKKRPKLFCTPALR